ncbi:hypothetical protein ABW19_dt0209648 [Dactylella cylindrospora]|nr:hypothetical protein ABW19_dt0209648 [Dactylella cylindrospora]
MGPETTPERKKKQKTKTLHDIANEEALPSYQNSPVCDITSSAKYIFRLLNHTYRKPTFCGLRSTRPKDITQLMENQLYGIDDVVFLPATACLGHEFDFTRAGHTYQIGMPKRTWKEFPEHAIRIEFYPLP